jgi:hypothetical protein
LIVCKTNIAEDGGAFYPTEVAFAPDRGLGRMVEIPYMKRFRAWPAHFLTEKWNCVYGNGILAKHCRKLGPRRNRKGAVIMETRPSYMECPDRYEIATEVLSSAVRVLLAAGFYESEVLRLFEQVARKKERAPVWLTPLENEPMGRSP